MDVQLLTEADLVLSKCGRPELPRRDLTALYIPKSFLIQNVFPAATTSPTQTITKEIVGDTFWCLRSMQIIASTNTAVYLQILKPDGRFLINNLQDVLQIAGYGSFRYLWSKELQCPPGSKIQVTFQVTDTTLQQPISILFGGAYLYLLTKGGERVCPNEELAAKLPRYFGNGSNQNIMAPCWQQGYGPKTPPGMRDEEFVYCAINGQDPTVAATSIAVTAANVTGVQQVAIQSDAEFHVRRILFKLFADNTVTSGLFLGRIRDGSGYTLTEDYIDLRQIGSAPMPKDWVIKPGDSVYIDLQLVDQTGTGNMGISTYLEGYRRRYA